MIRLIAAVGLLSLLNGCIFSAIPIQVLYGLEGANAVTGIAKNVFELCVTAECLAKAPAKAVDAITAPKPQPLVTTP